MIITKADGTQEEFRPGKLRTSLARAGAVKSEVDGIVRSIESTITNDTTTQEIYRKAFELLHESAHPIAAKYSLRRALFGLGPTGFPFEDFLARLFEAEGYKTKTRLTLRGKCATHEIDVAAYSPDHSFIVEAKFHMRPGIKSDIQVAMYSYARYLDLKEKSVCKGDVCGITDLLIVTNTKFTTAAIKYASCVGLSLLSWDQPRTLTLQDRIEQAGLYPITVLSNLTKSEKARLLLSGHILCRDLIKRPETLAQNGISTRKTHAVIDEARQLFTE
jgi:hypothetical protein